MRRLSLGLLSTALLALALPAHALLFSGSSTGAAQTITGITLSNSSFAGGAASGTAVGAITVTLSPATPAFSGTLTLTGAETGSGNDAKSFQIAGANLETDTAGGATDEPGQYGITIVASGAGYTNSGYSQPETIQATGLGGAGWQLAFSDEFSVPKGPRGAYMLNWQNQQQPVSITWGANVCPASGATAGAAVVLASPSGWSPNLRAGNTVSLVGATNTGTGAINSNFAVCSVTDDEHFAIYMPGTAATWGTIGVSGATIGTGPWVAAIVKSCASPCSSPTMAYTNNGSEGWAPENVTVGSNGLSIVTQNTAYTSADGVSHTYKSGHIETWNGNAGFAEALGSGLALDFYGEPSLSGGADSGIWATYWALGSDNSWPGTGSGGGEIDVAEFGAKSTACALTQYDMDFFDSGTGASGAGGPLSSSGTFIGALHQFTTTQSGTALTWDLDGTAQSGPTAAFHATDSRYPVIDVEFPSNGCSGNTGDLPQTQETRYVRVYAQVTSGACYAAIPTAASGIVPHQGSC